MALTNMEFYIVIPEYGENFVKNPVPYSKLDGYTGTGAGIVLDDTHTRRGPQCIKVMPSTGAALVTYMPLSATSGKTYTFSVDIKGVAGQAMSIFISNNSTTPLTSKSFIATGNWQRIEVTRTMTTTSANYRLNVARPATASTEPFWVDGFQFEESDEATTFFQGYERGLGYMDNAREYGWLGESRNSTSYRSAYTRHGGRLLRVKDYARIVSTLGLGQSPYNQVTTPIVTGGEIYQRHFRQPRDWGLMLVYNGNTIDEMMKNRAVLLDAIRPDKTPYDQPLVVRVQGFDDDGNEVSEPVDIVSIPITSHTDLPKMSVYQKDLLMFRALDGHLQGAFKNGKTLDYVIQFPSDYVVRCDPQGRWTDDNGNNPVAGALEFRRNGLVELEDHTICTGDFGQEQPGDAPTGTIYAPIAYIGANGWVKTNVPVVVNPGLNINYSLPVLGWGTIGIGHNCFYLQVLYWTVDLAPGVMLLRISKTGDVFTGEYITHWTAWIDIDNPGFSTSAQLPDGYLYIGGKFDFWHNGGYGTMRNIMRVKLDGSERNPLSAGLNGAVNTLKMHPDGRLLVGGEFTDANGSAGDHICWWDGTAFHSFTELGAAELNGKVNAIDVMRNGVIVIGGAFTGAGGDPNANYIAQWNGTNWQSISGVGANAEVMNVYCDPNGKVYISGLFTEVGGFVLADRVAVYKHGAWFPLEIDLPGAAEVQSILVASDSSLYLGGLFTGVASAPNPGEIEYKLATSAGSANTYPELTIVGPGVLNSITNHSTGRTIKFNDLTLLDGEELFIDFNPIKLNLGSSWSGRGSVWRYLNAGSDIGDWYIKPGTNSIGVFISSGYDVAKTKAYIHWQPKYWSLDGAVFE